MRYYNIGFVPHSSKPILGFFSAQLKIENYPKRITRLRLRRSAIASRAKRASGHRRALAGIADFQKISLRSCAPALSSGMPKSCSDSQDNQTAPVRTIRKSYAKSGVSAFSASAKAKLFSKVP